MAKNSWSHYNVGAILARKQIDWSMFTWGSAIPTNLHNSFKDIGRVNLERELNRKAIILIFEGQEYEAHIQRSRIDGRKDDTYQLRYDSTKPLIELITSVFQASLSYIISERERRKGLGETRPNVVTPLSIAEYVDFCFTQDPNKLELKFHPLYEQTDDELLFQTKVMATQVEKVEIVDAPKEKNSLSQKSTYSYKRDALVAKRSLVAADYRCEFDGSHEDFTCDATKRNYVEAHHLIPLEYRDEYPVSLDVEANIVALCPSCHRKIHLAIFSEKKSLIDVLYDQRTNRLDKCGLPTSKDDLYRYYQKN